MNELLTTRSNPMIDPTMHVWGWEIPVYLFLGGFVAGMMIISGFFLWRGRHKHADCVCLVLPGISLVLLSVGMLALFLDLEHKAFVWRLYTTFEITSPMSWGAWILVLVYPALLTNMILRVPDRLRARFPRMHELSKILLKHETFTRVVGVSNMVLGGMLGVYTGILLSSLGARPLWSSPILGLLFLTSGLSGAAAFVHLVAKDAEERVLMAKSDNAFLTIELFIIVLYLLFMLTASEVHMHAAQLLLSGGYAAVFWVFVVLLGIVIPLIYQSLATSHRAPHCGLMPIFVILGGLALRFVIVQAGQHSHWVTETITYVGR